jgi:hypothetical protein
MIQLWSFFLTEFLATIEKQHGKAKRTWVRDRGIPAEEVLAEMRKRRSIIWSARREGDSRNFGDILFRDAKARVSCHHLKAAPHRKSVEWRGAMDDARRYRVNAADCLLAAKSCQPDYHAIILSVSACWHSLAIEDEAIDLLRDFEGSLTRMISALREPQ